MDWREEQGGGYEAQEDCDGRKGADTPDRRAIDASDGWKMIRKKRIPTSKIAPY